MPIRVAIRVSFVALCTYLSTLGNEATRHNIHYAIQPKREATAGPGNVRERSCELGSVGRLQSDTRTGSPLLRGEIRLSVKPRLQCLMDKFLHGEIPFERLTLHPFPLLRIHFDTRRLPVRRGTCVIWHVRKPCHCCPFLRLWGQVHVFHVLFAFHHKFYFLPRLCIFPQLPGIMPH